MRTDATTAVIDTNVVVSAVLHPSRLPAFILSAGIEQRFMICFSDSILAEYREVLTRGKFGFPTRLVDALLDDIQTTGRRFRPTTKMSLCRDPHDDKFVECAEKAQADYIVTGNIRHFPPRHHGTDVVSPRQFVTILMSIGQL